MKHYNIIHLFVMGHPYSGSTALWQLLKSSPEISALPMEGLKLAASVVPKKVFENRWDPKTTFDFESIKSFWNSYWDPNKNIFLEKSPPWVLRCKEINKHFSSARFIFLVRNPYAFVGSSRARFPHSSAYYIARFWCVLAGTIIKDYNLFKGKSILVRYEDFTNNIADFTHAVLSFLPQLKEIHPTAEYDIKRERGRISNKNEQRIKELTARDMGLINKELIKNKHILDYFSYDIQNKEAPMSASAHLEIITNYWFGHHAGMLRHLQVPAIKKNPNNQ